MIISLMKILSCKKHVEFFLDGKMYCNTVRYFRDEGYDELEGAVFSHPTTLHINSYPIPVEDLAGPVVYQLNVVADFNVFCMFSWRVPRIDDDKIMIDLPSQLGSIEQCIDNFGPHTVVIKNTREFIRRVELAIKRHHGGVLAGRAGVVRYINPDTHRSEPADLLEIPFFKHERFAHEKEFRFVFHTCRDPAGPLVLPIGDLRDIAFWMKTEDVYDSARVEGKMDPRP